MTLAQCPAEALLAGFCLGWLGTFHRKASAALDRVERPDNFTEDFARGGQHTGYSVPPANRLDGRWCRVARAEPGWII
ncbi:hypothetical protein EMIT0P218_20288 [Pseudomonas sp. IT-P218]